MVDFKINLDDKPYLSDLFRKDKATFKDVVGTFVNLMETAATLSWYKLPDAVHSSMTFSDLVNGVLNAVMTTKEIEPNAFATLEMDLHPLALISDKRKNLITGDTELYDWKSHFSLDSDDLSKEAIEHIIRKILYLVRWFDIDSVSKALMTNQFPIVDNKDIQKLPFQPALRYQQEKLGDLYIGKFLHDIGAFNCGIIDKHITECPACHIGELKEVEEHLVCPRCNAGFTIEEEMGF